MLILLSAVFSTLCSMFRSRAALELEHIALRHQIGVLKRSARKRPKLTAADRLFWVFLSRIWGDWRSALDIVRPATAIAWHRKGFRLFWTWKMRHGHVGRPAVRLDVRNLIRKMSQENPTWGARTSIYGSDSFGATRFVTLAYAAGGAPTNPVGLDRPNGQTDGIVSAPPALTTDSGL